MQAVGYNPENMDETAENFAREDYRKDGNLYFDQSLYKDKKK